MEKKPKVKNKGKMALFLLAAGAVVIGKFAFKVGIIHTIRMWFENIF
ncbi:histidine kinase [Bacillus sp. DX4.1]|nr:histidine kinase [Bacillus sp. DX4.1]MDM5186912.1 histidine kinase [Bacillus sp. DX4.1]